MKTFFLLAVGVLLFCSAGQAQDNDHVGPMAIEDALELPGWFSEDFLTYVPQPEYHNAIPYLMEDVEILCIMGTWCSDSKREVPRMIRILQTKNIAPEKLRLIAVDRTKRDPAGVALNYGVDRVPTFIFLRNGLEIGRIVEAPLASLEKDMLGIIDPNAGKGAPPPPPPDMPPPPVTIEDADGTVQPEAGQHPHEHEHEHEHPKTEPEPPK